MDFKKQKEELNKYLEFYINMLKEKKDIQVDIVFVKKVHSEKKYKASVFLAKNDQILETVTDTLEYAKSCLKNRELTDYDFEYSKDQTVEVVEESLASNQSLIEGLFSVDPESIIKIGKETDLNGFDFISIQLCDTRINDPLPKLILHKKHLKEPAKFKAGKRFLINDEDEAELMKDNVLVISSSLDSLCVGGHIYIFDRSTFNSIMGFTAYYEKVVNDKIQDIRDTGLFSDADGFIEKCKTDGRYLPRLTKIILEGGFDRVDRHKSELETIRTDYKLGLCFNDKGEIDIEESPINEILNLLADHYVISALTKEKRVALGFESIVESEK